MDQWDILMEVNKEGIGEILCWFKSVEKITIFAGQPVCELNCKRAQSPKFLQNFGFILIDLA